MERENIRNLVTLIVPVHQDERRFIWEPVNGMVFRRMDYFDFAGATGPGGNHYHRLNMEVFLLIAGTIIRLAIENVLTKEGAVFEGLGPGTRIVMPVFHAHAMYFAPGSKMIAACSRPYSDKNGDMHPYHLMNDDGSVTQSVLVNR